MDILSCSFLRLWDTSTFSLDTFVISEEGRIRARSVLSYIFVSRCGRTKRSCFSIVNRPDRGVVCCCCGTNSKLSHELRGKVLYPPPKEMRYGGGMGGTPAGRRGGGVGRVGVDQRSAQLVWTCLDLELNPMVLVEGKRGFIGPENHQPTGLQTSNWWEADEKCRIGWCLGTGDIWVK